MEKMVIIGGGPAGLTAAIYGARANTSPLVFEGFLAGGQLMETTEVENFPGFPDGVKGPELMKLMRRQAERLGARFITEDVTGADLRPKEHVLRYSRGEVKARTVIIATGATAKKLGLEGEAELAGRGVSWCATCDGFFFRDKDVAVIGGGDAALEEASYLAGLCRSVKIVHRRSELRASAAMQEKVKKLGNVEFVLEHIPLAFVPTQDGLLKGVRVRHVKTGGERLLEVDGAFEAVGHAPQSLLFAGQLETDDVGYIKVREGGSETSVEGVFSAGDVHDNVYQQAVTAAGSGCRAALDAIRYLEGL
ncbi:MAG: thioredoxin-disulfide reductase [Pseudomonadota bacterium]